MKQKTIIEFRVRVRWWVIPYLKSIALFSLLTQKTPNMDRIGKLIANRGIKLEQK